MSNITTEEKLDFYSSLFYLGSYDVLTLLHIGKAVGDNPSEVGDIIAEYLKESGYTLEQVIDGIDLIAIYNREVLYKADSNFEELTGYSLLNDGECDFFANYSDCPFCCKDEETVKNEVIQSMIENEVCYDDLSRYSQYILSELNITDEEIETEREKQTNNEDETTDNENPLKKFIEFME